MFFFFSIQNIKNIVTLFFSSFLQWSFFDGKFIPSQLYLFIKVLFFVILCRSFFISSWFNSTLTAYWKHLLSLLSIGFIVAFMFFIQSGDLYTIHHNPDLFCDIYNAINEYNRIQTHYLPFFKNDFEISFWVIYEIFLWLHMLHHHRSSWLSLFECITGSSLLSYLEELKLFVTADWIFHVSDFSKLFMISFKYCLILIRYY